MLTDNKLDNEALDPTLRVSGIDLDGMQPFGSISEGNEPCVRGKRRSAL